MLYNIIVRDIKTFRIPLCILSLAPCITDGIYQKLTRCQHERSLIIPKYKAFLAKVWNIKVLPGFLLYEYIYIS